MIFDFFFENFYFSIVDIKEFVYFFFSFILFCIILGDFDFYQLEVVNRYLGFIFFMLFVFFVFFVLINMFLVIINDIYFEVKGDMVNQMNEFEMIDYFKRVSYVFNQIIKKKFLF